MGCALKNSFVAWVKFLPTRKFSVKLEFCFALLLDSWAQKTCPRYGLHLQEVSFVDPMIKKSRQANSNP